MSILCYGYLQKRRLELSQNEFHRSLHKIKRCTAHVIVR